MTVSWSGGKDSAYALYKAFSTNVYEVVNLHTIINKETKRVGMHGVPEALIDEQAKAIGLPVRKLYLERTDNHDAYANLMKSFYEECVRENIAYVLFGDIFLEDLRKFREELLTPYRLTPLFPLWGLNTRALIKNFLDDGFKMLVCCVNAGFFTHDKLGKTITETFLSDLDERVDACGENGEFHTFVYDGPLFKRAVAFDMGDIIKQTYEFKKVNPDGGVEVQETVFLFQDLLLHHSSSKNVNKNCAAP